MSKKYVILIAIITGLLLLVLLSGCTADGGLSAGKNMAPPAPETGIQTWIAAVNAHDVTALYYLAPAEIRNQVTLDQFKSANANNTFLENDRSITGYEILNRTGNASRANIKAAILLHREASGDSNQTETIPIYLNYEEWFEDGVWKVWTIPWS